jgi:putative membrane protein
MVDRVRNVLYAGRVTLITYVAALALMVVGGFRGVQLLETVSASAATDPTAPVVLAALVHGAVRWFAAAGVTSSLGQITDEYLSDSFKWRYMNAPFYVAAIAIVLHALSAYALTGVFLLDVSGVTPFSLTDLAVALTAGTLLGVLSTLTFAVAESRFPTAFEPA